MSNNTLVSRNDEYLRDWPAGEIETQGICPLCESTKRDPLHTGLRDRIFFCAPGSWNMFQCRDCTAAYLDPRPGPEFIWRAYQHYYTHSDTSRPDENSTKAKRLLRSLDDGYLNTKYGYGVPGANLMGAFLLPLFPLRRSAVDLSVRSLRLPRGGGRLLDVGCGNGDWLHWMRDRGWEVTGQDIDPKAVQQASSMGIDVRLGDLDSLGLKDGTFDAITLSQVIEHLHDPIAMLRICYSLLKPGGTLWLGTPNIGSDNYRRFGADWRGLEPPRHLVVFTAEALKAATRRAGFVVGNLNGVLCAEFMYIQSFAISQGLDPNAPMEVASEKWREFRQEDLLAVKNPSKAAIITLTATRPLT